MKIIQINRQCSADKTITNLLDARLQWVVKRSCFDVLRYERYPNVCGQNVEHVQRKPFFRITEMPVKWLGLLCAPRNNDIYIIQHLRQHL